MPLLATVVAGAEVAGADVGALDDAPVLTPVVTQLGLIMITIVNGAIFVELVFGLPGLGRLTVQALINSDYPVILAITLIGSFLVMLSNLLVDLLYPLLDPRAADSMRGR